MLTLGSYQKICSWSLWHCVRTYICIYCRRQKEEDQDHNNNNNIAGAHHPFALSSPSLGKFREPVKDGADVGVDFGDARHTALHAPADQPQQLVVGPGPPPAHCSKRKQQQIEHKPVWIVFLILSLYSYNLFCF